MRQSALLRILPTLVLLIVVVSLVTFPLLLALNAPMRLENRKTILESIARFIDSQGRDGRSQQVQQLGFLGRNLKVLVFSAWLFDENRKVIAPVRDADELPEDFSLLRFPSEPGEVTQHQAAFMDFVAAVRLPGEPAQYLVVNHRREKNNFSPIIRTGLFIFVWGALVTLLVGGSVLVIVFRAKEREASHVIERLADGDLAARFKISRLDEAGRLMLSFNEMADDIEALVLKLRSSEQKRAELVQEIGHDLRTPITSVRLSLESLDLHYAKMSAAQRKAAIRHGLHELSYMHRLIEYLFILSKTGESSHNVSFQKMDLAQLLEDEIESRRTGNDELTWRFDKNVRGSTVLWADPSLISRMVRNVLDNSVKYAKREVVCSLEQLSDKTMALHITDDGPGLSAKGETNSAQTPITPAEALNPEQSLGKGLNIIRAIAALHEWDIEFGATTKDGSGTRVTFRFLPAAHDTRKAA